jgi:hypothetical protein
MASEQLDCRRVGYYLVRHLGETWKLGPCFLHRDAGLLEQSNARVFLRRLKEEVGEEGEDGTPWQVTRCGHWAVGWVEHLSYDGANEKIVSFLSKWDAALADYPVADEMDYSELEQEALGKNVEQQLQRLRVEDDKAAGKLLDWLENNHPGELENKAGDQGAYPDEDIVKEGLRELGFLVDED